MLAPCAIARQNPTPEWNQRMANEMRHKLHIGANILD